jgi:hypothetical protein
MDISVADIPIHSDHGRAFGKRFWRAAFLLMMLLECLPFWAYRYFPSQDGPTHLHNASVLANYGSEAIYRQYYRVIPFQPAGNALTQVMLAAILKVADPVLAEKLLLSGYVILFFLSFRYLLSALTPYADCFSLFAGILVSNYFLDMGFWNFCYSICLLMFTLGYYARWRQRWRLRQLTLLCIGGLVVYMTHAVSWVVCVVAVAILGLPPLISAILTRRTHTVSVTTWSLLLQYALPLGSLLPPAIFMLMYLAGPSEQSAQRSTVVESLRERLWSLYSFSFLHTTGGTGFTLAKAGAATVAILLLSLVALAIRRRRYSWRGSSFLILSLACAALAIIGPDSVRSGLFIHVRVAFYACLFLVVWLALQSWPRLELNILAALFCAMVLITLALRFQVLSEWNQRLSDFVALGQKIRPGSTVLWLTLEQLDGAVNPYHDAVGLLSQKAVIDLRNYEASADHFLTQWQPERSPVPALGTVKQLGDVPPVFDIVRYEKETHGRVDYIIFQGHPDSKGDVVERVEVNLYREQIASYTLASPDQHGSLRLYQRTAPNANYVVGANQEQAGKFAWLPPHSAPSSPPRMDLVYKRGKATANEHP